MAAPGASRRERQGGVGVGPQSASGKDFKRWRTRQGESPLLARGLSAAARLDREAAGRAAASVRSVGGRVAEPAADGRLDAVLEPGLENDSSVRHGGQRQRGSVLTMDSYYTPRSQSTPIQSTSSSLKDYLVGATPLQKRLESVRKQTSFARSPPRRKIPPCSQLQEDVDPHKVAFLLHKQWTLYSLTPMYKFSYNNLKEYSRLLSAFIVAEKQKGIAVEVGEDFNIKVIFSTLLGMKGTHRDPEAFLIQILSKSQLPSKDREDKVLWTGWFCSVFGDNLLETVTEDFTCLPLFLANGAESNTAIVGTWFQKTFDCSFSPLAISAFNLSWLAAMWTACQLDRYTATTEFLWSVPCRPQSLDISYAIHPEDAKALWDSVHKTPGEVTQEEVDLFMDCLYSHFYRHFRIHLSATRLVRVSTSVASAHTDGKIKILCHKYLIGVLAYLTELAVFQIE